MRKQNNLLPRRTSKNNLVSFLDSYDPSELASGPDVLSPTGFSNLLSHFLQEVHQLSWGEARRAATLAPCFQSHGTIDNTQSVLGAHLADSIVGGGRGWKETGCLRLCYRVTVL